MLNSGDQPIINNIRVAYVLLLLTLILVSCKNVFLTIFVICLKKTCFKNKRDLDHFTLFFLKARFKLESFVFEWQTGSAYCMA